jgi:hypothetical protein
MKKEVVTTAGLAREQGFWDDKPQSNRRTAIINSEAVTSRLVTLTHMISHWALERVSTSSCNHDFGIKDAAYTLSTEDSKDCS